MAIQHRPELCWRLLQSNPIPVYQFTQSITVFVAELDRAVAAADWLAFLQWSYGCPSLVISDSGAIRPAIADAFVNLSHTGRGDVRADRVAFFQRPNTGAVTGTFNSNSDRDTDRWYAYR